LRGRGDDGDGGNGGNDAAALTRADARQTFSRLPPLELPTLLRGDLGEARGKRTFRVAFEGFFSKLAEAPSRVPPTDRPTDTDALSVEQGVAVEQ